jgi:hypothetical protein
LREAGADRCVDFAALLFGAALDARDARDDFVAGSTESIAAMRSACVIPAMSGGGPDVGAAARALPAARDAEETAAPSRGAPPSFARSAGFADAAEGSTDGRAASTRAGAAEGAGARSIGVAFFSDSGVPSGARRTM